MRLALLALAAFALAGCGESHEAAESAPTVDPLPDGRFVPATRREGERVVMPLVFPDGTRAELTYSPELALAALGVVPYGSATLQGDSPHPERSDMVGRDFRIRYGANEPDPTSLVFDFGRWRVEVYDYSPGDPAAMTGAERRDFLASLSGRVTDGGFLVLEASAPLTLAEAGEHAGPALEFGSPGNPPWVSLMLQRCGPRAESTSPGFASWCLSDSMRIHAAGGRRFLAAAAEGIDLR